MAIPRPRINPVPPEILKAIGSKSASVREAADSLSNAIGQLCGRMARIPGRVEAEYFGKHPQFYVGSPMELGLKFHKVEREWTVSWCEYDSETAAQHEDYSVSWKPLSDAPHKIQMAAVSLIPYLLAAMEKKQDEMIEEYKEAEAEANRLILEIDAAKKEATK